MLKNNVTRGHGILENFLAKKRIIMSNKLIPQNLRCGRILDIGCGAIPFVLLNTTFNYKYGLDVIVNTNYSKENMIIKKFDIEKETKLPFEDVFFDVVTMLAVFEHIEPSKLVNILVEIRRILKPNGRFILTTPAAWTDKLLKLMAKLRLVSPEEINEHKGAYHKRSIALYLENSGFEKEKMHFGYFEMFLNNWAYVDK